MQESKPAQFELSLGSETDELLMALRVKAAAFSNESWSTHWLTNGPQILIDGWKQAYPDVPLSRVGRVCSVEFLTPFITETTPLSNDDLQQMTLQDNKDCPTSGDKETEVACCGTAVENDPSIGSSVVHELEKLQISDQDATQEINVPIVVQMDTSASKNEPPCEEVSDENITAMWKGHYNSYYWFCFQSYQQEQLLASAGEEVSVM